MGDQFDASLDLMRRLPPHKVEENLRGLVELAPDITDELLSAVDQPLKIHRCAKTGRDYVVCDYNRDGDSYRSPWSNEYNPELPDGTTPSESLRKLEVQANDAFDTYREMYYEGGVSSVYLWDQDDGFAGVILIKKVGDSSKQMKGAWDSIHVFEASERGRSAHYKLTSTVLLYMITSNADLGNVTLSGSMTRQAESDFPLEDPSSHIGNLGRLVEDMELRMRNLLEQVYFGKTKDIMNDLRSVRSLVEAQRQNNIQKELLGKLNLRKAP